MLIVLAIDSVGIQAGLVVGSKALGTDIKILGISLSSKKKNCARIRIGYCQ
jgi:hypothetical protein